LVQNDIRKNPTFMRCVLKLEWIHWHRIRVFGQSCSRLAIGDFYYELGLYNFFFHYGAISLAMCLSLFSLWPCYWSPWYFIRCEFLPPLLNHTSSSFSSTPILTSQTIGYTGFLNPYWYINAGRTCYDWRWP
jgi:hypothetical protein